MSCDTVKTANGQTARCSLGVLRVDLERPGFNGLPIALPNWTTDGFLGGQLSAQQFPLLPLSIIVSRDLSVETTDDVRRFRSPECTASDGSVNPRSRFHPVVLDRQGFEIKNVLQQVPLHDQETRGTSRYSGSEKLYNTFPAVSATY